MPLPTPPYLQTSRVEAAPKDWYASGTVWGGLLGLMIHALRLFKGWSLDEEETRGIIAGLAECKGTISLLIASAGGVWFRLTAHDFDKGILRQRSTWCGILAGVGTILTALGFGDMTDLAALAGQTFDAVTTGGGLLSALMIVYFRVKANRPILIRKTQPFDEEDT